jgi:hypothetical protein
MQQAKRNVGETSPVLNIPHEYSEKLASMLVRTAL